MKLRPVTYNVDAKKMDAFRSQGRPKVIAHTFTDSTGTYTTYDSVPDPNANVDYSASDNIVQSGFIAQEVEKVAKSCGFNSTIISIPADSNVSSYGLNYSEIVVPLVKAVQEQQKMIDTLKTTVDSLKSILAALAPSGQRIQNQNDNGGTQTDVTLSNRTIVLDQNKPNPFKDNTTITYEIKSDFSNAIIIFTDMAGDVIKEVPITEKGKGQLNVYAYDLSSGIYTYTIVVDGQTIDSKKMVKQ